MRRQLTGNWKRAARWVAISFALFQLYIGAFGRLPDMQQPAVFIAFSFVLTLLLFSSTKRAQPETKVPIGDILLIGLVIAGSVNTFIKHEWFLTYPGKTSLPDLFLGAVIVILALEVSRRTTGWTFPVLTMIALLYAFIGPYIPGLFGHGGFSLVYVIRSLNQTTLGVYGFITGIAATILPVFIIFGSFLLFSGGGQTFIEIALRLAGKFRGGPALVAVIASSMFGTISGSAVINVATTGNFTIPLMKRLGYKPEFAGGVEAAASAGGQIMPPIMGAGAFVMAELLGISYLAVAIAAVIPAILYYTAVFAGVRFRALSLNLPPVPAEEIPKTRQILTWGKLAPLVFPIAALFYFLIRGYSLTTAGFWACAAAAVLFLFSDFSLAQMKQRVRLLIDGLEAAAVTLLQIAALLVCANIVVHLIGLTGVGVKFSSIILSTAGNMPMLALIMTALVSLVLGMGIPTTAAYLTAAAVTATSLVKFGILPIAAHLFIFYFAVISCITPPVSTAVFAASGIAKANWLKIAAVALRLGMVAYIIPFIFVYQTELLMKGNPLEIIMVLVFAVLGAVFLAAGIEGYLTAKLRLIARLLLIPGAVMLLLPGWQISLTGIAMVALALLVQRFRSEGGGDAY